jgi:C1A family cysteine protease
MNKLILIAAFVLGTFAASAVEKDTTAVDTFRFTTIKENKITSVKNQASSGTCWSFSALGFFEAELLRMGKQEVDLSEMFVVHHSYSAKADKFVRMTEPINFAVGGSLF